MPVTICHALTVVKKTSNELRSSQYLLMEIALYRLTFKLNALTIVISVLNRREM